MNDLVQKREKWLKQTHKDATAATAITALKSIRAITETHFGKPITNLGSGAVTLTRRGGIHPSFSGRERKRCFRAGGSPSSNSPRVDLGTRCIQLVPPDEKAWLNAQVWDVEVSKEKIERWPRFPKKFPVVALSQEAVMSYLAKRFEKLAKKQSGLARAVLTAIMMKLSTKPPSASGVGQNVQKIQQRFVVVKEIDTGDEYGVHVESTLSYALDAVQGGQTGVQNALKSAANSIAGQIRKKMGAKLTEDLDTPFPEVKKR